MERFFVLHAPVVVPILMSIFVAYFFVCCFLFFHRLCLLLFLGFWQRQDVAQ